MKLQIAILDFGSQYTHLIARRIRQLGVLAKIYPPNVSSEKLKGVSGIILSGGPQSVHGKQAVSYDKKIFLTKIPILGLCYGHQLMVHALGGKVKTGKTKEYGIASISVQAKSFLLKGLKKSQQVWMSHGDSASKLPDGFISIAKTSDCPFAGMENEKEKRFGLQFHPEVAHTTHGIEILNNFVFDICKCKKNWSLSAYSGELAYKIKRAVGTRNVFLLVSGGVDSTVAFALLEKILGKKRVFGLHIDNGFTRLNESSNVKKSLTKAGFNDLVVYDASEVFLDAVKNISEPELKRKKIGRAFLDIKDLVMKEYNFSPQKWMLGQGTIYPDTIETGGTKHADTIKTHHNRVQEVLKLMKMGQLIEPLADLYKDEVRELGKKLKVPKHLLDQHPCPGPGLAVRTLCSDGFEKVSNASSINKKLQKISGKKFRASVLPVKSVGVQGDNRTYRHPAVLSGIGSWKEIGELSVRITNEFSEINRVTLLLHPHKVDFKKIKIKKAYLTKDRLDLLRQIDHAVHKETRKAKIYHDIWQFPVILAPMSLKKGETVILRPIQSQEAMTVNFYQMKKSILQKIIKKIISFNGVDMVLYDVTNKPPGTIEWE